MPEKQKKKTPKSLLGQGLQSQKPFKKKKKKKGKYGGDIPARKEVPGNPHGITKKDQEGNTILMAKDGGSASKFGMLSVKAGIDNNPNPTQADRIAGATKKMKRGGDVHPPKKKRGNYGPNKGKPFKAMGPVGGLPVNKAGTKIMSDKGQKGLKQIKKISKSLFPLDAASVGAVSAIKGLSKLAGRLAKRGYGKARK